MVGLIIYCIGAIIAFGLLYSMAIDVEDPKDTGMAVVGMALSWFTVILIIYKMWDESRKDTLP